MFTSADRLICRQLSEDIQRDAILARPREITDAFRKLIFENLWKGKPSHDTITPGHIRWRRSNRQETPTGKGEESDKTKDERGLQELVEAILTTWAQETTCTQMTTMIHALAKNDHDLLFKMTEMKVQAMESEPKAGLKTEIGRALREKIYPLFAPPYNRTKITLGNPPAKALCYLVSLITNFVCGDDSSALLFRVLTQPLGGETLQNLVKSKLEEHATFFTLDEEASGSEDVVPLGCLRIDGEIKPREQVRKHNVICDPCGIHFFKNESRSIEDEM